MAARWWIPRLTWARSILVLLMIGAGVGVWMIAGIAEFVDCSADHYSECGPSAHEQATVATGGLAILVALAVALLLRRRWFTAGLAALVTATYCYWFLLFTA